MHMPTTDTIGTAIFKEAMEREKKCVVAATPQPGLKPTAHVPLNPHS